MHRTVLVSVIVPVFNAKRYLEETLRSLLSQSEKNVEIILVDDGSTDGSSEICRRYAKTDGRIRWIEQRNQGAAAARNSALSVARGTYVAFLDSDDLLHPAMLATLLHAIKISDADAVFCDFFRFSDGKKPHFSSAKSDLTLLDGKESVLHRMFLPMLGAINGEKVIESSVCRALYRREIVEKNSITFRSERRYFSEDLLFNLAYLLHCNQVALLSDRLYAYRMRKGSVSTALGKERFSALKELITCLDALCRSAWIPEDEYLPRLDCRLMTYLSLLVKESVSVSDNKTALLNIRQFDQDEMVKEALIRTDPAIYPRLPRLFASLMRKKRYALLYALLRIYTPMVSWFRSM